MRLLPIALSAFVIPSAAFADAGSLPLYLFGDIRYLLFVGLYVLLTVLCILFALSRAEARDRTVPFDMSSVRLGASFILTLGLAYQMMHHLEHVSQIFQYWYLDLRPSSSKGLLFFLDLEWNHFIFDSGYFLLMGLATLLFLAHWRQAGNRVTAFGWILVVSSLLTQGWHAVEHTVRISRHIAEGCDPCRGIVDAWTGWHLIPLHFWYNVFALTLPLMLYFYFRMDRRMAGEIRALFGGMRAAKKGQA